MKVLSIGNKQYLLAQQGHELENYFINDIYTSSDVKVRFNDYVLVCKTSSNVELKFTSNVSKKNYCPINYRTVYINDIRTMGSLSASFYTYIPAARSEYYLDLNKPCILLYADNPYISQIASLLGWPRPRGSYPCYAFAIDVFPLPYGNRHFMSGVPFALTEVTTEPAGSFGSIDKMFAVNAIITEGYIYDSWITSFNVSNNGVISLKSKFSNSENSVFQYNENFDPVFVNNYSYNTLSYYYGDTNALYSDNDRVRYKKNLIKSIGASTISQGASATLTFNLQYKIVPERNVTKQLSVSPSEVIKIS